MPIRIGVFVCHCGTNIGGIVNVPEVVEYVQRLPNVVFTEGNLSPALKTVFPPSEIRSGNMI